MNERTASPHIEPLAPISTSRVKNGSLGKKIDCILFDIYGTLFISGSGDIGTAKAARSDPTKLTLLLGEFDIRRDPLELLETFYASIEKAHAMMKKQGIDHPEVRIDRIWMKVLGTGDVNMARNFAAAFEMMVNPVYPMPNLDSMLSIFKERRMLMGIVSNAQFYTPHLFQRFFNADMEDLGVDPDLVFFSYRHGQAKPSTVLFEMAKASLKAREIPADSVLYLGNDMLNDIYPAVQTGFLTALFAGDARSLRERGDDPRCKALSPDLVITDLIQLPEAVLGPGRG